MSVNANHPGGILKALQDITTGLTEKPPTGLTQLAAGGKVSTVTEVLTEMKQYLSVYRNVETTANEHEKALQVREQNAAMIVARVEEIQTALKGVLGKQNPDLTLYGLKPNQKAPPPTVEQMAERVAKNKATRLARHTMGPKQKKAIKGQWPPADGQTPPGGQTPPPASTSPAST